VLEARTLRAVLAGHRPGASTMVTLAVDGQELPVLLREVQQQATTGHVLHVEFYHMTRDKLVKAKVPLAYTGDAPAAGRGGMVLRLLDNVDVEALPRDLPEALTVDLSSLEDMNQSITVADLAPPPGVTIQTDPATLVAKVQPPKVEVEEAAAAEEEAAAPGAAGERGSTEG
jgi:large subunit ribosomal protein L25